MSNKKRGDSLGFRIVGFTVVVSAALFCFVPLLLIVSGSFTDNRVLMRDGYGLLPRVFSTEAYDYILKMPAGIASSYLNTTIVTAIGTALGLFCITMTSYVLQRKDFKYRNGIAFFIYFTTIFGGGLIPWFILLSKYLGMQNTYLARLLPLLMTPFLIFLMRTFIQTTVPVEMLESAKIDGAGDFRIYRSIVMPTITPGLATVGLFLALTYWNDWYLTSLFITKSKMYSLQYYLYDMLNSIRFAQEMAAQSGTVVLDDMPTESIKMAMVVVVTGPVVFLYPFVQRYFVSGLTIGSVKG
jgi:putative aldouronate transport system permease protein